MNDQDLLIALSAERRLDRGALCQLALTLASWRDAALDDAPQLAARLGVPSTPMRRALRVRDQAAAMADRTRAEAARLGCDLLTLLDDAYPAALHDLALPPPVLYCRGHIPAGPAVAMVGARKLDAYGRQAADHFARQLAAAGITVVSGFALGIDTVAHQGALAAGGHTVAVLGCGIDIEYPRSNTALGSEIAARGAVISEFPPGTQPRPWHFPIRNRVIAALAMGTLVVQATVRSGSLITAHHALELGREVYAIPGRVFDELARGPNALLADGAMVARSPQDILDNLSLSGQQMLFPPPTAPSLEPTATTTEPEPPSANTPSPSPAPLTPSPGGLPGKILDILVPGTAQTAEEIADAISISIDRTLGALLELELAGWLRREPGPVYVR